MAVKSFAETRFYSPAEMAEKLSMNPDVILRKIRAGEIEACKPGKGWKIEERKVWEWLERNSNKSSGSKHRRVAVNPFAGRKPRKLPGSREKRILVLGEIPKNFKSGQVYTEREVSQIIRRIYPDFRTVCRELVAYGMMTCKGGKYKVATSYRPPWESLGGASRE